jgi:plastocyanin
MKRTQWVGLLTVAGLLGGAVAPAWAQDAGTIKGKIIFKGDKEKFKRVVLDVAKDPNCKTKIGSEDVVLNTKTDPVTVRNALIQIKNPPPGKYDAPSTPVTLDQKGCQYSPHVLAMMEGQELEIRNSDPTNHNVHFLPKKNEEYNKSQPKQDMVDKVKLVAEQPFKIKCDVHPWMGAYIAVFNHPFFSVTGEEGVYEIKNVPPGKYTVEVWHEHPSFGTQTLEVEVGSGATVEKDFVYEPK